MDRDIFCNNVTRLNFTAILSQLHFKQILVIKRISNYGLVFKLLQKKFGNFCFFPIPSLIGAWTNDQPVTPNGAFPGYGGQYSIRTMDTKAHHGPEGEGVAHDDRYEVSSVCVRCL